uniref:Ig-like domain-containing protein n=1 Tax=Acanthochromis polyacanthus TaxID=80966 RepID=A0A3Q1H9V3_9TELE
MSLFLSVCLFAFSGCIDDHNFVTETVGVGQNVTLTCTRQTSSHKETLHWIRLVSGKYPEFLGGTHTFDSNDKTINKTPRITAKQGPGAFILQIHETQLSDSGFYYCIKVKQLNMEFMNTTFLRIKEPEPVPPSDPEHPGDPVTLKCCQTNNKSHEMHHSKIRLFVQDTERKISHKCVICHSDICLSISKCVYNFSKTITSSDAGTYYCAMATCGQILFGNGRNEDSLFYSAPTFSKRKIERRNPKTAQEETVYNDVRTSARN